MANPTEYRVYVDGIWDLFHQGHANVFQKAINKAQEYADGRTVKLLVGVCSDGVSNYKRETIMTLDERCTAVKTHKLVTDVIKNSPLIMTREFIDEHQIDLIVHGDDFTEEKKQKYYGAAIKQGKYAEVPYTPSVSTSDLIRDAKRVGKFRENSVLAPINQVELIDRIQKRTIDQLKV